MIKPSVISWIKQPLVSAEFLKQQCSSIIRTKQAHALLLRTNLFQNTLYTSKLLTFLTSAVSSSSHSLKYAHTIFTQIRNPDPFIFNTMIRAHARVDSANPYQAFSFYRLMVESGVAPDNYTYPFVISACLRLKARDLGEGYHCVVIKNGLVSDLFVINGLIQFYGACGCCANAWEVFDTSLVRDIVAWNVMINACVDNELMDKAFALFGSMKGFDDVRPDDVTVISLVSGCAQSRSLDNGKLLHLYSKEVGLDKCLSVGNAILDMYCKCGDMKAGQEWFDEMPVKDILSWTSMLSGFCNSGYFQESLYLFRRMQLENVALDEIRLVSVLSACAQTGALDQGKYIHNLIERSKVKCDIVLETALVDMYAKCGAIGLARQVFYKMRVRNVFTWNSMIGGLAMHGHAKDALSLFEHMNSDKVAPDDVTFIAVLCACSHAGLVEDGRALFHAMKETHKLQPRMEHYGCMVDLLCRAKLVDDALTFIKSMPIKANSVLWATLLGACKITGQFELAEKVGRKVIESEPDSCGRYIMLSNLYASNNQWDNASSIRKQMQIKGISKTPGCSWIELNGILHQFVSGDRSHGHTERIYAMVKEMIQRVNADGAYKSTTAEVFLDIEEEEKEHSLFFHSEKLAVALGLISTSHGLPIRIVKNLRVCNDCHSFLTAVSKIYNRDIVARDRSRFHHFSKGSCSCLGFW